MNSMRTMVMNKTNYCVLSFLVVGLQSMKRKIRKKATPTLAPFTSVTFKLPFSFVKHLQILRNKPTSCFSSIPLVAGSIEAISKSPLPCLAMKLFIYVTLLGSAFLAMFSTSISIS
ncbi:hypothetical protein ACB094_03G193900 [Castanea mollissima]